MELSIIVTCFNEKPTILKAVEEARNVNMDKEIIIIDNCSTDGSAELIRSIKDEAIIKVFQPQNYGYGQSVKTGSRLAKGDYVYIHNSDLEYDIECVHRMVDLAKNENLDAVFGSRLYARKQSALSLISERPYYLGTLITTSMINIFYGKNFSDIIGTRLYRNSSFKKIRLKENGIGFDFEIVSKLCKGRFKIKEVPVSYKPRSSIEGKKVKPRDIIPALLAIFNAKFFNKD